MKGRLSWGILGTGSVAHSKVRDLHANGFEVGAVGSRSTATAQAFAAEFDLGRAYG